MQQPEVPRAVRALGLAVLVVAVAVAVVFVVQLILKPGPGGAIESLTFSQSQPEPGFPKTADTVSEQSRLDQFTKLTRKYSIDVKGFDISQNDVCTGGITTTIALRFTDSSTSRFRLYDCSGGVAKGTFVTDATALVASWQ